MSAAGEAVISRFTEPGTDTDSCVESAIIASAVAMPAPLSKIQRVSGTAAMTTIGLPYPDFEGTVIFIPTAAFTGATGGAAATTLAAPIGLAFTAVVGKALYLTFIRVTGLWYPSYVA